MTDPITPTGQQLLANLTLDYEPQPDDVVMPAVHEGLAKDIKRIEREAAAAAIAQRDALAEALRGADHCHSLEEHCPKCGHGFTTACEPDPKGVIRLALDAIKEEK